MDDKTAKFLIREVSRCETQLSDISKSLKEANRLAQTRVDIEMAKLTPEQEEDFDRIRQNRMNRALSFSQEEIATPDEIRKKLGYFEKDDTDEN